MAKQISLLTVTIGLMSAAVVSADTHKDLSRVFTTCTTQGDALSEVVVSYGLKRVQVRVAGVDEQDDIYQMRDPDDILNPDRIMTLVGIQPGKSPEFGGGTLNAILMVIDRGPNQPGYGKWKSWPAKLAMGGSVADLQCVPTKD